MLPHFRNYSPQAFLKGCITPLIPTGVLQKLMQDGVKIENLQLCQVSAQNVLPSLCHQHTNQIVMQILVGTAIPQKWP